MHIISHILGYFNSEVAASRSEVMPCGIVKLLFRSSEVKCSAYRAEGTLHARSALHLQSILHVPLAEHLVQKTHLCRLDKSAFFVALNEYKGQKNKVKANKRSTQYRIFPRFNFFVLVHRFEFYCQRMYSIIGN